MKLLEAILPVSLLPLQNEAVVDLMLSLLPDLALQTEDEHTHEQACRCLAAVINRMPAGISVRPAGKDQPKIKKQSMNKGGLLRWIHLE